MHEDARIFRALDDLVGHQALAARHDARGVVAIGIRQCDGILAPFMRWRLSHVAPRTRLRHLYRFLHPVPASQPQGQRPRPGRVWPASLPACRPQLVHPAGARHGRAAPQWSPRGRSRQRPFYPCQRVFCLRANQWHARTVEGNATLDFSSLSSKAGGGSVVPPGVPIVGAVPPAVRVGR